MKTKTLLATLSLMMGAVLIPLAAAPVPTDTLNRTVLPIPEPKNKPITILDARNAKAPPRFQVKAPEGAPNVLVILIDDQGFGVSSAFGGPVK
jgi:arylsulfatase